MAVNTDFRAARSQFYKALKDSTIVDAAIDNYAALALANPDKKGRAMTYTGALVGSKAQSAFWPHEKLSFVNRGLKMLDDGLAENPKDLEALFIHGTACHYLPDFLGRAVQVRKDFDRLLALLPKHHAAYDDELLSDIIQFMEANIDMSPEQQRHLSDIKEIIG